jgi:hypothetical protein
MTLHPLGKFKPIPCSQPSFNLRNLSNLRILFSDFGLTALGRSESGSYGDHDGETLRRARASSWLLLHHTSHERCSSWKNVNAQTWK